MLGLGDIVIPGIFIAFLLRFDQRFVQFEIIFIYQKIYFNNHLLFIV